MSMLIDKYSRENLAYMYIDGIDERGKTLPVRRFENVEQCRLS